MLLFGEVADEDIAILIDWFFQRIDNDWLAGGIGSANANICAVAIACKVNADMIRNTDRMKTTPLRTKNCLHLQFQHVRGPQRPRLREGLPGKAWQGHTKQRSARNKEERQ
jgi:hypothetical protein